MLDDLAAVITGCIFQRFAIRELLVQHPHRSCFALTVPGDICVLEVHLNDGVVQAQCALVGAGGHSFAEGEIDPR